MHWRNRKPVARRNVDPGAGVPPVPVQRAALLPGELDAELARAAERDTCGGESFCAWCWDALAALDADPCAWCGALDHDLAACPARRAAVRGAAATIGAAVRRAA